MRSLLFCGHSDPARRYALAVLGWLLALSSSASATESVPALAAEHAVVITDHTSLYLVDARNVSQMRRQLDARGPVTRFGHPAAALTRHTIEVEYVLGGRKAFGGFVLQQCDFTGFGQHCSSDKFSALSASVTSLGALEHRIRYVGRLRKRCLVLVSSTATDTVASVTSG